MQTKKNNQQHIIIRARCTGQCIVYLAFLLHEHSKVFKLSGKRLVREIIDELGHPVVRETSFRETSVRESDCPGNVLSGKRLSGKRLVRESDCPGNVCKAVKQVAI